MRTLDRYITLSFIKNLLLSWVAMAVLFLFQAMFTDLYDHNYSFLQIFVYHLLGLPHIFAQMAPPGVLLASVLTLSGLSRTQELIACYTIGYSLKRIVCLFMGVLVGLGLFLLVSQDRLLPAMYRFRTNYYWREMQKKPDFFLDIRRDKIWYRSKNMIYNLQRFDNRSQTIVGMSVYTFDDDFNLTQVINAGTASFASDGWRLHDGSVTLFSQDSSFPLSQSFKEKKIVISETPKEFQEIEKEVDGLRLGELGEYIERMTLAGADTKGYQVKYHARISLTLIPMVMCLLSVPFSVSRRREGTVARDLTLCLGVTFLYWLFYSVSLSLGTNGSLAPMLAAWLPSLVFLSLTTILIVRKQ